LTKYRFDPKELALPETIYVRDIENQVLQGLIVKALMDIKGIALLEGNVIDHLLGRDAGEGIKGIYVEQDSKHTSIHIKIEVQIAFGFSIPEKAEEIQSRITELLTQATGLHVSCVHVVFKKVFTPKDASQGATR